IQGDSVSLTANTGTIGTSTSLPVIIQTGTTPHVSGLTASAAGNIWVQEKSGDLYLTNATSLGGDVWIKVVSGGLIENTTTRTPDQRTQAQLLALYNSMALQGTAAQQAADAAVTSFEALKTREYLAYWNYRHLQETAENQTDASFVFDPNFVITISQQEQ